MSKETIAPSVVVEEVVVPVVAIDNTGRVPSTSADKAYGFPTVANPAKISKRLVGIISAKRYIVAPTLDDNNEVVKQGIVLITIMKGTKEIKATIGSAYLGAIEGLGADCAGKHVSCLYEMCELGVTTYEDATGLHFHGVNGNRITEISPMDESAYTSYLLAEEHERNIGIFTNPENKGMDLSALAMYLKG